MVKKFTKGYWQFEKIENYYHIDNGKASICSTEISALPDEENYANVQLIANAPELLDALNDLVEFTEGRLVGVTMAEVLEHAKETIRLATE